MSSRCHFLGRVWKSRTWQLKQKQNGQKMVIPGNRWWGEEQSRREAGCPGCLSPGRWGLWADPEEDVVWTGPGLGTALEDAYSSRTDQTRRRNNEGTVGGKLLSFAAAAHVFFGVVKTISWCLNPLACKSTGETLTSIAVLMQWDWLALGTCCVE